MGYLTSQFGHQVPEHIRDRGLVYRQQGRVRIIEGDAGAVTAVVIGTSPYPVELLNEHQGIATYCACPYFEGGLICKHIWATLLAAEERGLLASDITPPARRPPGPRWAQQLDALRDELEMSGPTGRTWPPGRQIIYLISPNHSEEGGLIVDVVTQDSKRDGSPGRPKALRLSPMIISQIPDALDRQILFTLAGSQSKWSSDYEFYSPHGRGISASGVALPSSASQLIVPLIARTERAFRRSETSLEPTLPLSLDDGPAWEFCLQAQLSGGEYEISGRFERGDERLDLEKPDLVEDGFIFLDDGTVARLGDTAMGGWITMLRGMGSISFPAEEAPSFIAQLVNVPVMPKLDFPAELSWQETTYPPRPRLSINRHTNQWGGRQTLGGILSFGYGAQTFGHDDPSMGFLDPETRKFVRRDRQAESEAEAMMLSVGWKIGTSGRYEVGPRTLPRVVRSLVELGWYVEAEGRVYRSAGPINIAVRSGVDWFELSGGASFDGAAATLPDLLAAVRKRESFVQLDDGSLGLVPEEWLERYGLLAGMGAKHDDALRFNMNQAAILDVLLSSQQVDVDATFARWRERLRSFDGIEAASEPAGFKGELRGYQRDGLGWLKFLQEFGLGGCLADDMGLGKTIQVLAMLETRRTERRKAGKTNVPPSLVVVPRSLIFNWVMEAERFTPKLKILEYTGARLPPGDHFNDYDMILTTYGTLRRDAPLLTDFSFDYCILDEAQAIKNANTASAKAVRLIKAEHRLAMSGTPIENHLGELWSLFEFLDPGMLGSSSTFDLGSRNTDPASRDLLAKALRPFILRRTKDQVATDLPPKTEQTLYCDLGAAQRKHYDQLRNHYRKSLLTKVDSDGIAKSKVFILEALLRLRQAACHPGLIEQARASESSAKLDVLIPHLVEVAEEGHRALVFSQFTKMLAIVRTRLDAEGISYEYLDGRTRDRQARVDNFQNDAGIKAFLISLKAGGLGLNLTRADYVFLLDPWWNPAVEAQAIDRTHRIGQTSPVFAYRIIARDTVEEKVLELQSAKRDLADAIITADNSILRTIQREDLELLLS